MKIKHCSNRSKRQNGRIVARVLHARVDALGKRFPGLGKQKLKICVCPDEFLEESEIGSGSQIAFNERNGDCYVSYFRETVVTAIFFDAERSGPILFATSK